MPGPSRHKRRAVYAAALLASTTHCTSSSRSASGGAPVSFLQSGAGAAGSGESTQRRLAAVREQLLAAHDRDCDEKLTILDRPVGRFELEWGGRRYAASGVVQLSNLLQELTVALETAAPPRLDRIDEPTLSRLSRRIREEFWPALTRRVDREGLAALLDDDKVAGDPELWLYVPGDDPPALEYFREVAAEYDQGYEAFAAALKGAVRSPVSDHGPEAARAIAELLGSQAGRRRLHTFFRSRERAAQRVSLAPLASELLARAAAARGLVEAAGRACSGLGADALAAKRAATATRLQRHLLALAPRRVNVRALPPRAQWPPWVQSLGPKQGPLSLALRRPAEGPPEGAPFVVPGGRFNEMYGWDSYFILLGLIADGRLDLARGIVDNFVYSVEHYGAILNANRSYYLTRSQPPFLGSMIRAVWDATPPAQRDGAWLASSVEAARSEYWEVWSRGHRRIGSLCRGQGPQRVCLARYEGTGRGQPPEVEPGHFRALYRALGESLEASYQSGALSQRDLAAELDAAFRHDRCMRESGHDTTYRWFWPRPSRGASSPMNRCADVATVDLNGLLYRYELDLTYLQAALSEYPEHARTGHPAELFCQRARERIALMKELMWSPQDALFYDVLVTADGAERTGYVSATTLYPLWASTAACPGAELPLDADDQRRYVQSALRELEAEGGLLATAKSSREQFSTRADRQWEYPNGWAPHQILAWYALIGHGFQKEAKRLASAWLSMVASNAAAFNGTIPEKYDVVARSHAVFAEYGNVGTDFDYIAREGFGWVNASVQLGLALLAPAERAELEAALGRPR